MNVRDRRIELGYTQQEFADAFGFKISTVSAVETHKSLFGNMPRARREKWAKALQCTVEELLKSDASTIKTPCMVPCKTYHMDKEKLELYLKARWGDKIGKVRDRTKSVLSKEYAEFEKENRFWNVIDRRMSSWG